MTTVPPKNGISRGEWEMTSGHEVDSRSLWRPSAFRIGLAWTPGRALRKLGQHPDGLRWLEDFALTQSVQSSHAATLSRAPPSPWPDSYSSRLAIEVLLPLLTYHDQGAA